MAARRKPRRRSPETPLAAHIRRLAVNYMADGQRDWAHGMMFAADKVDDAHAEGTTGQRVLTQLETETLVGYLKTSHDLLARATATIEYATKLAAGKLPLPIIRTEMAPVAARPVVPAPEPVVVASRPEAPNAKTRAAMKEAREGRGVRVGDVAGLMADLNKPELSKPEGRVLAALRKLYPEPASRRMLGLMTLYRHDTGNFGNVLGALRGGGLIEGQGHERISLTPFGLEVAPSDFMPTGLDVCQAWINSGKLSKVAREILTAMFLAPGNGFPSREACATATATGYRGDTGNFGNGLSELRGNGLIDGLYIWKELLS